MITAKRVETDRGAEEMIDIDEAYANLNDETKEILEIVYERYPDVDWPELSRLYKHRGKDFLEILENMYITCHENGYSKSDFLFLYEYTRQATLKRLSEIDPEFTMD